MTTLLSELDTKTKKSTGYYGMRWDHIIQAGHTAFE